MPAHSSKELFAFYVTELLLFVLQHQVVLIDDNVIFKRNQMLLIMIYCCHKPCNSKVTENIPAINNILSHYYFILRITLVFPLVFTAYMLLIC